MQLGALCATSTCAVAASAPPLSAVAALETVRFMVDTTAASPANPQGAVSMSPDGERYVARLVRGDASRDGVRLQMIAGRLQSLTTAARFRTIAQQFSSGLGAGDGQAGANQDASAQASPIRWVDDEHVAYLWSDAAGRRQVVRTNVRTGDSEVMTRHPTSLINFDVSPNGVVLYCAHADREPDPSAARLNDGFVIEPQTDAPSLLLGHINEGAMADRLWSTEWFVLAPGEVAPRRLSIAGRAQALDPLQRARLSPDGNWALVNTNAPVIPAAWNQYDSPDMARYIRRARADPTGLPGRVVHQLWLVNLTERTSRPLWPAVVDVDATRIAWRADARAIALAPTFLPPQDADAAGRRGTAAAVIERDTGRYERLPIDLSQASVLFLRWRDDRHLELLLRRDGVFETAIFEKHASSWRRVAAAPSHGGVRIELQQDLNTPPVLVAVESRTGHSRRILDPNPDLTTRVALGRVESAEGAIEGGAHWRGLLFYPPDYRPGQRYPLVIQSVYGPPVTNEFTLYGYQDGYGLGPTMVASYPGRVLAARGLLVLHLNVEGPVAFDTPQEADLRRRAFEQAAQQLVARGLVDQQRVGLVGFSRNGFYVEYTLTHSSFPFAAAVTADNWDAGYVAQTFLGYNAAGVNGAAPFGEGLALWRENAPGFGADRVHTPLLQIEQSHALLGVLVRWELFGRLRYLKRPVEFYVMPRAGLGVHNTQNPTQILAVQTRSADWLTYWLKNEESDASQDRAQYERWRLLREWHDASSGSAAPGHE